MLFYVKTTSYRWNLRSARTIKFLKENWRWCRSHLRSVNILVSANENIQFLLCRFGKYFFCSIPFISYEGIWTHNPTTSVVLGSHAMYRNSNKSGYPQFPHDLCCIRAKTRMLYNYMYADCNAIYAIHSRPSRQLIVGKWDWKRKRKTWWRNTFNCVTFTSCRFVIILFAMTLCSSTMMPPSSHTVSHYCQVQHQCLENVLQ